MIYPFSEAANPTGMFLAAVVAVLLVTMLIPRYRITVSVIAATLLGAAATLAFEVFEVGFGPLFLIGFVSSILPCLPIAVVGVILVRGVQAAIDALRGRLPGQTRGPTDPSAPAA